MKISITIIGAVIISNFYGQAQIEAIETVHNFDTVQQFGKVTHDFKFINTGNEPLIITKANTSCGCDVSNWSKDPILPGDTAIINYKYDSKRIGPINKSMTVTTNAINNPTLVVRTKGYIFRKEEIIK